MYKFIIEKNLFQGLEKVVDCKYYWESGDLLVNATFSDNVVSGCRSGFRGINGTGITISNNTITDLGYSVAIDAMGISNS